MRGAVDVDVSGATSFIVRDYELPFNTDVVYEAQGYDDGSLNQVDTETFRIDYDECEVWLVDIARPTNSMRVTVEALPALTFEMPTGLHRVLDRADPILTTLPARSPTGEAVILTDSLDERDRLRDVLGSGYPLMARATEEVGIGDTYGLSYFGVTGFIEERILARGRCPAASLPRRDRPGRSPRPFDVRARAAADLLRGRDRLRELRERAHGRPHLRRVGVHVLMIAVTDRFLAALRDTHTISVAAHVYRPSAPLVAVEVPVVEGSLTMDADARVRRQASLEVAFALTDPLTPEVIEELPFGGLCTIERGIRFADGDIERVQLGLFRVDAVVYDASVGVASLTLADRMVQVQDEPLLTPWAPVGLKPSNAAVQLVTDVFGVGISYHVLTTPATRGGDDRRDGVRPRPRAGRR